MSKLSDKAIRMKPAEMGEDIVGGEYFRLPGEAITEPLDKPWDCIWS